MDFTKKRRSDRAFYTALGLICALGRARPALADEPAPAEPADAPRVFDGAAGFGYSDGSRVIGEGITEYRLPTTEELPGVLFRDIRIKTVVLGGTLNQYESIVLFGPDQLARRMRS